MIKFESRFDENAYRLSNRPAAALTALEEGQFVTPNASGQMVLATSGAMGFMAMSSKRDGRDNITDTGLVTYLVGPHVVYTDQIDTNTTFTAMMELTTDAEGKLTEATSGDAVVGFAFGPAGADGFLKVIIK